MKSLRSAEYLPKETNTYHVAVCDVKNQKNDITEVICASALDAVIYCIQRVCNITKPLPEAAYDWQLLSFAKDNGFILSVAYTIFE